MNSSVCATGFLIPEPRMPPWWRWYYYLDPGERTYEPAIPHCKCVLCTISCVHLQHAKVSTSIRIGLEGSCITALTGYGTLHVSAPVLIGGPCVQLHGRWQE